MASTNSYGSTFQALATRFKRHDEETTARLSSQSSLRSSSSDSSSSPTSTPQSPSRANPPLSYEAQCRRASYFSDENHIPSCPACRLPRLSTIAQADQICHTPKDGCCGNLCPDISVPTDESPSPSARLREYSRRHSLLCPPEMPRKPSELSACRDSVPSSAGGRARDGGSTLGKFDVMGISTVTT